MYWLQGANTLHTSGTSTPRSSHTAGNTAPSIALGDSLIDFDSPSESQGKRPFEMSESVFSLNHSGSSTPHSVQSDSAPQDLLSDLDPLADASDDERQSRQRAHTNPQHASTSEHVRSPSLPPSSPTRLSTPEIQRTQSSYFTPPSFPSRWVNTLLTSRIRAPRTGPSTPPIDATSIFAAHDDSASSSSARISAFSRSAPHSRAATVSEGAPLGPAITHGTPFASHTFVPPSGAPGFTGDRQWDKGFEFDKAQVERRSVRLTGRKEVTAGVLTVELADKVRVCLFLLCVRGAELGCVVGADPAVLPGARSSAQGVVAPVQPGPARDLAQHAVCALRGLQRRRAPCRAPRARRGAGCA